MFSGLIGFAAMIWERAVELEEERHDLDRQVFENARGRRAGHAVSGVDGDLERFDPGDIDQATST